MNPFEHTMDDSLSPADQQLLEQLADGELSDAECRELIARLERMPGGWRSCALAFLETQYWQKDLGAIARESKTPAASESRHASGSAGPAAIAADSPAPRPRTTHRVTRAAGTLLAMAATFLIALVTGTMVRDAWRSRGTVPGENEIVQSSPETDS